MLLHFHKCLSILDVELQLMLQYLLNHKDNIFDMQNTQYLLKLGLVLVVGADREFCCSLVCTRKGKLGCIYDVYMLVRGLGLTDK